MWLNDGDEYFYDKNEWVRVRIEDEHWNDLSPIAPSERGSEATEERKSPYSITVHPSFRKTVKCLFADQNTGFYDTIGSWAR